MQGRVSPRFFFTTKVEGGTALFYCRGLDNRALTSDIIQGEINSLHDTLAGDIALWNYTGWSRTSPDHPAAQPPASDPGTP